MPKPLRDPIERRTFVASAAKTLLGLGTLSGLGPLATAAELSSAPLRKNAKAKSVIYLYLNGGMSHLDTFDTKPGSITQGPVESLQTNVVGVSVSEFSPHLA